MFLENVYGIKQCDSFKMKDEWTDVNLTYCDIMYWK